MSISGSLRTMSIEDLLAWIDKRRLVGHLSVERGDVAHSFHFEAGAIRYASSNVPGEHLGQLLKSSELVTEKELSEAFRVQADTGVFLGKVLLMSAALDEKSLTSVLELKVRESLWDVLSWEGGHFQFEEGEREGSEFEIRVSLGATLDLGIVQVKRWRTIRREIDSDSLSFWVTDFFKIPDPKASERVRAQTLQLVECIERGLTVNQIVLEHCGRRFQVLSLLLSLIERGAIKTDRRSERRADSNEESATEMETAARSRAAGGNKAGALEISGRALQIDPESQSLQTLHRELQRSLFAELSRELLGTFRVPKLIVDKSELCNYDLSDHERYIVGRVDGHWDLLSLMRLSPIREVDVLLTFKRLHERGIIDL